MMMKQISGKTITQLQMDYKKWKTISSSNSGEMRHNALTLKSFSTH